MIVENKYEGAIGITSGMLTVTREKIALKKSIYYKIYITIKYT